MVNSRSFFSASSTCGARWSGASTCALSSSLTLRIWPWLMVFTLAPFTAIVPELISPGSRARHTICTNNAEKSFGWTDRNSRKLRCAGAVAGSLNAEGEVVVQLPGEPAHAEHVRVPGVTARLARKQAPCGAWRISRLPRKCSAAGVRGVVNVLRGLGQRAPFMAWQPTGPPIEPR